MNFTCRACVEGESERKKLRSGRKRQWRGQIRKVRAGRTGVRRTEKRDGQKGKNDREQRGEEERKKER